MLLLIKKHTDTLTEQSKTKPQETVENKMNKQMETFSLNPPLKMPDEDWFLATNSFFNINDNNDSFSFSIPSYWRIPNYLEEIIIEKLNNLLKLKSENVY